MKSLLGRMGLVGAVVLLLTSAAQASVCSDIKAKCYATCSKLLLAFQCNASCTTEYRACVKSGSNSNSGGGPKGSCQTGNKAADAKCNQGHNVTKGGSNQKQ